MSRDQLVAIARKSMRHFQDGTVDLEPAQYRVATTIYTDPDRWKIEVDRIFKRLPLMLAFSCELQGTGAYRALEVAGVPVLLTRSADGAIRAFVNMCSHRGAIVVEEGIGTARRFSCPYHAWTYDTHGDLVGVLDAEAFGDLDRSCLGLTPLPVAERAGMIWVVLTPGSTLDIDSFLCGYGEMLEHLDLASCHMVGRQSLVGPNWKLAYDGYIDFYHLPILHRNTFGPDMSSKALYDAWGPHQRLTDPGRSLGVLAELPEEEWTTSKLVGGVWTIFPHVSIAAFDAGGRVWMVSQLFPGKAVGESITVQNFLHTQPPDDEQAEIMVSRMAFNHHVVQDEDYYTGLRIQRAVETGAKKEFIFGRNEGGAHRFHRWVQAIIEADTDDELAQLFVAESEIGRAHV